MIARIAAAFCLLIVAATATPEISWQLAPQGLKWRSGRPVDGVDVFGHEDLIKLNIYQAMDAGHIRVSLLCGVEYRFDMTFAPGMSKIISTQQPHDTLIGTPELVALCAGIERILESPETINYTENELTVEGVLQRATFIPNASTSTTTETTTEIPTTPNSAVNCKHIIGRYWLDIPSSSEVGPFLSSSKSMITLTLNQASKLSDRMFNGYMSVVNNIRFGLDVNESLWTAHDFISTKMLGPPVEMALEYDIMEAMRSATAKCDSEGKVITLRGTSNGTTLVWRSVMRGNDGAVVTTRPPITIGARTPIATVSTKKTNLRHSTDEITLGDISEPMTIESGDEVIDSPIINGGDKVEDFVVVVVEDL